jgi:hypothetical protein
MNNEEDRCNAKPMRQSFTGICHPSYRFPRQFAVVNHELPDATASDHLSERSSPPKKSAALLAFSTHPKNT